MRHVDAQYEGYTDSPDPGTWTDEHDAEALAFEDFYADDDSE